MKPASKLQAQADITEILSWKGSDVINWQDKPGPGGTDLEAYWDDGTKWLLQVKMGGEELNGGSNLGKLRLRAVSLGAVPVIAAVEGEKVIFRSAVDDELLEVP